MSGAMNERILAAAMIPTYSFSGIRRTLALGAAIRRELAGKTQTFTHQPTRRDGPVILAVSVPRVPTRLNQKRFCLKSVCRLYLQTGQKTTCPHVFIERVVKDSVAFFNLCPLPACSNIQARKTGGPRNCFCKRRARERSNFPILWTCKFCYWPVPGTHRLAIDPAPYMPRVCKSHSAAP
jgi:hypothetical protein